MGCALSLQGYYYYVMLLLVYSLLVKVSNKNESVATGLEGNRFLFYDVLYGEKSLNVHLKNKNKQPQIKLNFPSSD